MDKPVSPGLSGSVPRDSEITSPENSSGQTQEDKKEAAQAQPDSLAVWVQTGYVRLDREEYAEAAAAFDRALQIDSSNEGALKGKIVALRGAKELDAALAAAGEAAQAQPDSLAVWVQTGYVRLDREEYAEAAAAFDRALQIDSSDADALEGKIVALRGAKELDAALAAAGEAAQAQPDSLAIWYQTGYVRLDREEYAEAAAAFDRALQIDSSDADALEGKIVALRRAKELDAALAAAGEAAQAQADSLAVWVQTGYVRLDREEYAEAAAAFDRALQIDSSDADAHQGKILALRRARQLDAALAAAGEAAQAQPDSLAVWVQTGYVRLDREEYAEAAAAFDRALQIDSSDADALEGKIVALRGAKELDAALAAAGEAAQAQPDSLAIWVQTGWVRLDREEYAEAAAAFDRALQIDSSNEGALEGKILALRVARQLDAALAAAGEAAQAQPDSLAIWYQTGYVRLDREEYAEAAAAFDRALQIDSSDADAHQGKILALRRARQLDAALAAAGEAAQAQPDSLAVWYQTGWVRLDREEYAEAAAAFDRALQIDSSDADALEGKIVALRGAKELDAALAAAGEAAQAQPDSLAVWVQTGWVRLDREEYAEAAAAFDRALQIDSSNEGALEGKILALRRAKELDAALAAAGEAAQAQPDSLAVWVQTGYVRLDREEYAEAAAAFDRALQIDSSDADALEGKIVALRVAKELDAALAAAGEAAQAQPDSLAIWYQTGWVRLDREEYAEAAAAFDRALQIDSSDADAHQGKILALRRAKELDAALAAAGEAAQAQPDSLAVWYQTGWVRLDREEYAEAAAAFDRALQIDSSDADAHQGKILALRRAKELDAALAAAGEAAQAQPDSLAVWVQTGYVRLDREEYAEAAAAFDRALQIDSSDADALEGKIVALRVAKELDAALAAAGEAAQAQPDSLAVWYQTGYVRLDREEYAEAAAAFDRALQIDSSDADALEGKIVALRRARQLDAALAAAGEAAQAQPDSLAVWVQTGRVRLDREEYAEAAAAFDRALQIDSSDADAHQGKIIALRVARQLDAALAAAGEAAQAQPDSFGIWYQTGWVRLDREEYAEAAAAFDRALQIDSSDADALAGRIATLRLSGRLDEALSTADDALTRKPKDLAIWYQIGWIHADRRNYPDARAAFETGLQIEPEDEDLLSTKVLLLRMDQDFAAAEQEGRKLVQRNQKSVAFRTQLALSLFDKGDYEEALAQFAAILELAPNNRDALEWRTSCLRELRRFEEAEDSAKLATSRFPLDARLQAEVGWLELARFRYEPACQAFEKAVTLDPYDEGNLEGYVTVLRSMGELSSAVQAINTKRKRTGTSVTVSILLGLVALDSHDYREATEHFLNASRKDDRNPAAIAGLAAIKFYKEDYKGAEELFRRGLAIIPGHLDSLCGLALTLVRSSEQDGLDEAGKLCQRAIQISSQTAAAFGTLGVIAFRRGELHACERMLLRSIEADKSSGAQVDLGSFYVQLHRYDAAERHIRQFLEISPYDVRAHIELGNIYLEQDKLNDALREFREAGAIDSTSPEAHYGTALCLIKKGDMAAAETTIRDSLQITSVARSLKLRLLLVRLLLKRGQDTQQRDFFDSALSEALALANVHASVAEVYYLAGLARYNLGEVSSDPIARFGYRSEALRYLETSLRYDESYPDALRAAGLLRRDLRRARTSAMGGYVVAGVSLVLVGILWAGFYFTNKVNTAIVASLTPILLGMILISFILPVLIRLKLPGLEADIDRSREDLSPGPIGEVSLTKLATEISVPSGGLKL